MRLVHKREYIQFNISYLCFSGHTAVRGWARTSTSGSVEQKSHSSLMDSINTYFWHKCLAQKHELIAKYYGSGRVDQTQYAHVMDRLTKAATLRECKEVNVELLNPGASLFDILFKQ